MMERDVRFVQLSSRLDVHAILPDAASQCRDVDQGAWRCANLKQRGMLDDTL